MLLPSLLAFALGADVPLAGLQSSARLTRDEHGIAHVQASTLRDAVLVQGWLHASDRFFQMDLNRRIARGASAELTGPGSLPQDVLLRTLGLGRAAEATWPAYSAEVRELLQAYADGVNAWLAAHELPVEYRAVELTSVPSWQPVDSVAIAKLVAFDLSFQSDVEPTIALASYAQAGSALGFDGRALYFEDLHRAQPFFRVDSVPVPTSAASPATGDVGDPGVLSRIDLRLARALAARLDAHEWTRARGERVQRAGSNAWVLGGQHTESGAPLLAGDPHLGLGAPCIWYPNHLTAPGLDVTGDSIAGVPFVVLGHNRRVAWTATSNYADVCDWYQEQVVSDPTSPSGLSTLHGGQPEHVLAIAESYRANQPGNGIPDDVTDVSGPGIPPVTWIVPRRYDGPVLALDASGGTAISLQYTLLGPTLEIEALLAMNRASTVGEFRAGLDAWDGPPQNFLCADVHGSIAYFSTGELPLREDLESGAIHGLAPAFLRDGTGGNEWLPAPQPRPPHQSLPYSVLSAEDMPSAVNPTVGWIANCNNDPTGNSNDNDSFDERKANGGILYTGSGPYASERQHRVRSWIESRIGAGLSFSERDLVALQADTLVPQAPVFVPYLGAARARGLAAGAHPELAALATDPHVAEACARLASWDATAPTGIAGGYDAAESAGSTQAPTPAEIDASVAATLYAVWLGRLLDRTVHAPVDALGLPRAQAGGPAFLRRLLEESTPSLGVGSSGLDFFPRPGIASAEDRRDLILLDALRTALDDLSGPAFASVFQGSTEQSEYRWGRLHRIVLRHPLGSPAFQFPGPSFPGRVGDGFPVDGGAFSVDVSWSSLRAGGPEDFITTGGASRRFVAEAAPRAPRARSSLPGGTSGDPLDQGYSDLLPGWLTNDTFPLLFEPAEIRQFGRSSVSFVP